MLTTTIDVQQKSKYPTLQELLQLVRNGNEVLITDGQQPVAKLTPIHTPLPMRKPGLHVGAMLATDDFDESLPEDFWTGQG
jgi:antitoxin (DNA-binding transcriptional repressor) of toxin-antitoxin stability system